MQELSLIAVIIGLLNLILPLVNAIDPQCDFYQELVIGKEYYIYNKEYPSYYPPSTSCRWVGRSPAGTNIVLSCENIDLPQTSGCLDDKLSISLTGNENFEDASSYCGQTVLTVISENNAISVGLFAPNTSYGGRFVCALTAMQISPVTTTTTKKPNTCDCGWKFETRIIGGHDTGVNEYPPLAVMLDRITGDHFCGATIISERYALTAAHCFNFQEPENVGLLVGDFDMSTGEDTSAAALYAISEFKKHPFYDRSTQQNDIAVLKTKLPILFSVFVGPVCLPFRYTDVDFSSQTVTLLGWGFVDFSGPKSNTSKEVDVTVVSNQKCAVNMSRPILSNQICTYAPDKDACMSDSGGPLLWQDPETRRLQLLGVISYGLGCATSRPGVNTRMTSYLSWIVSVTSDAFYCIK